MRLMPQYLCTDILYVTHQKFETDIALLAANLSIRSMDPRAKEMEGRHLNITGTLETGIECYSLIAFIT